MQNWFQILHKCHKKTNNSKNKNKTKFLQRILINNQVRVPFVEHLLRTKTLGNTSDHTYMQSYMDGCIPACTHTLCSGINKSGGMSNDPWPIRPPFFRSRHIAISSGNRSDRISQPILHSTRPYSFILSGSFQEAGCRAPTLLSREWTWPNPNHHLP